jgi:hypothetical protein
LLYGKQAVAVDPRVGIERRGDDARDAGSNQRLRARGRFTMEAARFQIDITGRTPRAFSRGFEGQDFRMGFSRKPVPTLADDKTVVRKDTANPRIGMGCAQAAARQ